MNKKIYKYKGKNNKTKTYYTKKHQRKNDEKDKAFDNYINCNIIFAVKQYYRNQMKLNRRELTIFDDDEKYNIFINSIATVKDLKDIENKLYLASALEVLSTLENIVIQYIFLEDKKEDEVAELLDLYETSISRIKKRALLKMRKHLKGADSDAR